MHLSETFSHLEYQPNITTHYTTVHNIAVDVPLRMLPLDATMAIIPRTPPWQPHEPGQIADLRLSGIAGDSLALLGYQ